MLATHLKLTQLFVKCNFNSLTLFKYENPLVYKRNACCLAESKPVPIVITLAYLGPIEWACVSAGNHSSDETMRFGNPIKESLM